MKFLISFLCFSVFLSTFAQKTYLLKQDYPVGKKYDYSINSDQIINQKVSGKSLNYVQNVSTDYSFDITGTKGLDKNIKVTYKRITIKSIGMGNELILDSDKEEVGKQNPFAGLKNSSFDMVLSPNGSIKSVSGVETMVDHMAVKISTDTAQIKQIKLSLSKQFNSEVIRQTLESSMRIYPDKAIKVGDSWIVNSKMKITMPIESITTYTLKEIKDGIAILGIKATLISKGDFDSMGNKMQTDLKGMNIGDAQIDLKTGLILSSHTRIELYGKMKAVDQDIDFDMEGINKISGKAAN